MSPHFIFLWCQLMLVEEVAAAWRCDFRWIKLLDGLMLGIQCFLGELPFFLLAGVLLKRLGHVVCMTIVIATFGLRFVLYGWVGGERHCQVSNLKIMDLELVPREANKILSNAQSMPYRCAVLIIIIIYHDFLPTLRRGSHVKSDKTHTQSSRYTP